MKPHADFTTTQTVPLIAVQPSATPADANLPTEKQLKKAYQQLMHANRTHTKRGLEFGRMCYQLQQDHRAQGRDGEGFEALLNKLGIAKRTAYRWIERYMQKPELSATWHEVERNQPERRKAKPMSEGKNLQLPFDLPDNYPRKQWDEDVELLGGYRKITKLLVEEFVPKVKEKAAEKRREQAQTSSVQ